MHCKSTWQVVWAYFYNCHYTTLVTSHAEIQQWWENAEFYYACHLRCMQCKRTNGVVFTCRKQHIQIYTTHQLSFTTLLLAMTWQVSMQWNYWPVSTKWNKHQKGQLLSSFMSLPHPTLNTFFKPFFLANRVLVSNPPVKPRMMKSSTQSSVVSSDSSEVKSQTNVSQIKKRRGWACTYWQETFHAPPQHA